MKHKFVELCRARTLIDAEKKAFFYHLDNVDHFPGQTFLTMRIIVAH